MQSFKITNKTNDKAVTLHLGVCNTFLTRLRGLMFTDSIPADGGLLFVNPVEDRINSAIHMFFMSIDLTIIWLDSKGKIVDKVLARRWKTMVAPAENAKFIIETHADRYDEYNRGDLLDITDETIS